MQKLYKVGIATYHIYSMQNIKFIFEDLFIILAYF